MKRCLIRTEERGVGQRQNDDTAAGTERLTVQLVSVKKKEGGYLFDFDKLGRWIDTAKRCGIEYFEISHLFTQWGVASCPKIIADVNGEERCIFGWDTDADSPEYTNFLWSLRKAAVPIHGRYPKITWKKYARNTKKSCS